MAEEMAGGCDLNKRLRKYQSSPGNPPHRKPPSPKRCYGGWSLGILSCEGNGRMSLHVFVLLAAECSTGCLLSIGSLIVECLRTSDPSRLRTVHSRALSSWTYGYYVIARHAPNKLTRIISHTILHQHAGILQDFCRRHRMQLLRGCEVAC